MIVALVDAEGKNTQVVCYAQNEHWAKTNKHRAKRLKLRTSNCTISMFPGQSEHDPLNFFFENVRDRGHVTPNNFWR